MQILTSSTRAFIVQTAWLVGALASFRSSAETPSQRAALDSLSALTSVPVQVLVQNVASLSLRVHPEGRAFTEAERSLSAAEFLKARLLDHRESPEVVRNIDASCEPRLGRKACAVTIIEQTPNPDHLGVRESGTTFLFTVRELFQGGQASRTIEGDLVTVRLN
jgi:hypothetical protein